LAVKGRGLKKKKAGLPGLKRRRFERLVLGIHRGSQKKKQKKREGGEKGIKERDFRKAQQKRRGGTSKREH